jgi:DNA-binding response OmpR family regulator
MAFSCREGNTATAYAPPVAKSSRKVQQNVMIRPLNAAAAGAHNPLAMVSEAPKRLLLVEDDIHIADLLALHLRDERFEVVHCADGREGLRSMEQGTWDVLVLDVMLPGVDGLEICRRARAMTRYVPIVIISARGGEMHRILGLELGADDYLAKPFSVMELVARVKALLRRADAMARNARLDAGSITVGALFIDPVARVATLEGRALELTPREFDLLHFFARQPGKVFSRMALLDAVWGYKHEGYEHTVNTHINRLRAKIEADPSRPARILTVWGRGYKLAPPPGAAGASA